MSFTFPHRFKSSRQSVASSPVEPRYFELPSFDRPEDVRVLPYDRTTGELAERALRLYGAKILEAEFGVSSPEMARERIGRLAEKMKTLGWVTHDTLDLRAGEQVVNDRIDNLWQERAPQGSDAILTLKSLEELASAPERGFYADKAADMLREVQPDNTRIALK